MTSGRFSGFTVVASGHPLSDDTDYSADFEDASDPNALIDISNHEVVWDPDAIFLAEASVILGSHEPRESIQMLSI